MGEFKRYEHNPPHFLEEDSYYFITASTFTKQPYLQGDDHKELLLEQFKIKFIEFGWDLLFWVILDNHYHIIVKSGEYKEIGHVVSRIHGASSYQINKLDKKRGRKVWYNYWDSIITFENSYLARINYSSFALAKSFKNRHH